MKTTKKEMDKYLRQLQALQRDGFKENSPYKMEITPFNNGGHWLISVAIFYNVKDGKDPELEIFMLASYRDVEDNDKVMMDMYDYIAQATDAQRD